MATADARKWAVDLYEGDMYVGTLLLDGVLGASLETQSFCVDVYKFTGFDDEHRRARALLVKRERVR